MHLQQVLDVLTGSFQEEIRHGQSSELHCRVVKLSERETTSRLKFFIPVLTVLKDSSDEAQSLTLRPCVKKALLQTGGRETTIIMESRRGRGKTSED